MSREFRLNHSEQWGNAKPSLPGEVTETSCLPELGRGAEHLNERVGS